DGNARCIADFYLPQKISGSAAEQEHAQQTAKELHHGGIAQGAHPRSEVEPDYLVTHQPLAQGRTHSATSRSSPATAACARARNRSFSSPSRTWSGSPNAMALSMGTGRN